MPDIPMTRGEKTIKMDRMGQYYASYEIANEKIPMLVAGLDIHDKDEFSEGKAMLQLIGVKTHLGVILVYVKKLSDFNSFKPELKISHLMTDHLYRPEIFDYRARYIW